MVLTGNVVTDSILAGIAIQTVPSANKKNARQNVNELEMYFWNTDLYNKFTRSDHYVSVTMSLSED